MLFFFFLNFSKIKKKKFRQLSTTVENGFKTFLSKLFAFRSLFPLAIHPLVSSCLLFRFLGFALVFSVAPHKMKNFQFLRKPVLNVRKKPKKKSYAKNSIVPLFSFFSAGGGRGGKENGISGRMSSQRRFKSFNFFPRKLSFTSVDRALV